MEDFQKSDSGQYELSGSQLANHVGQACCDAATNENQESCREKHGLVLCSYGMSSQTCCFHNQCKKYIQLFLEHVLHFSVLLNLFLWSPSKYPNILWVPHIFFGHIVNTKISYGYHNFSMIITNNFCLPN